MKDLFGKSQDPEEALGIRAARLREPGRKVRSSLFALGFLVGCGVALGLSSVFVGDARAGECAAAFGAPPVSSAPAAVRAKPRLIVFSAPSGGGKTTLAQLLVKDFQKLSLSVSSTTRAPRGTEKDGVDYRFMSVEAFKAKIARGGFAEWAEVHGNYYGTDIDAIQGELAHGQSVLALVDVKGAESLRKSFPEQVFTVFISPPDLKTLEQRLRARGTDSEESILKRLENARAELAEAPRFDRVVVNDDLKRAHRELSDLIRERGLVPDAAP